MDNSQINEKLKEVSGWEMQNGHLTKTYQLDDFNASLKFVNAVGELAEKADHHPDILIQYNKVKLSLRTHDQDSITEKDFNLAGKIEQL
ncbi:4a-hydroxytetrahydrobiopterin dehydratase [Virgibacillus siamensis]|uniref:4a-hydroxytetrahydrobiopterin dehydratase n=1 Tax=Virgibacillus siamensis TaxID=480071 RepID=A0ABN1FMC7_9BACI